MADLDTVLAHLRDKLATWDDTDEDWQVLADALDGAGDPRVEELRLNLALRLGQVRGREAGAVSARLDAIRQAAGRRFASASTHKFGFCTAFESESAELDPNESVVDVVRPWFEGAGHDLFTSLNLELARTTDGHVEQLAAYREMARIRALELNVQRMTDAGLLALCRSPNIKLRRLGLNLQSDSACLLAPETLTAIGEAPWPLQTLSIHGPPVDDASVNALAATRADIRRLALTCGRLQWRTLGRLVAQLPQLVFVSTDLAADPGPPSVDVPERPATVELHFVRGVVPHLAALGQQGWLRAVRSLTLPPTSRAYEDGLEDLLASEHLAGLQEVGIPYRTPPDVLKRLLDQAPELNTVALSGGGLGEGEMLAAHPALSRLRRVRFHSANGYAELFNTAGSLAGLQSLSAIQGDWHGDPVRRMAERSDFRPEILRLNRLGLEDDDIQVLAASPILSQLRVLDLGGNKLGPEAVRALIRSPYLGRLEYLNLDHCSAVKEWMPLFTENDDAVPSLRELNVRSNDALAMAGARIKRGIAQNTGLAAVW